MAKKNNVFTAEQVQAIVEQAVAQALAQVSVTQESAPTKATGKKRGRPRKATGNACVAQELVPFTHHDGRVTMETPKRAAAWSKYNENFKPFDKEAWEKKRASYKPSKKLISAIKNDRASVTHKVAKDEYGFVGTKADLKALKDEVCK